MEIDGVLNRSHHVPWTLMDIRIKVSIRVSAIVSKDSPSRRRRYEAELTILEIGLDIVYQYFSAITGNLMQMLILKLMNS